MANNMIVSLNSGLTPEGIKKQIEDYKRRSLEAARRGAKEGAKILQQNAESTTAYRGITGATRTSTIAGVLGPEWGSEFDSAYNVADLLLDGNTEHDGKPYRTSIPGPTDPDDIVIVLTVPTDYIVKLETENAGAKAFLGDALNEEAGEITRVIAEAIKKAVP